MAKSVFIKCDNCDVEFKIYVTWLNRPRTSNCCSRKCAAELKQKKKAIICETCGVSFVGKSHQSERKYCSRRCFQISKSGENSHFFIRDKKPDVRLLGDSNLKRWKKLVKERDGFRCVKCGEDEARMLQAHHIVPVSENKELIFDVDNGITLCLNCHAEEHRDDPKSKALILSHYKQMKNENRYKVA